MLKCEPAGSLSACAERGVCACQRGSRAGVSALREADVSDVRGKCQSVVPAGRQDAHHALFRCLSPQSHSKYVAGDIWARRDILIACSVTFHIVTLAKKWRSEGKKLKIWNTVQDLAWNRLILSAGTSSNSSGFFTKRILLTGCSFKLTQQVATLSWLGNF